MPVEREGTQVLSPLRHDPHWRLRHLFLPHLPPSAELCGSRILCRSLQNSCTLSSGLQTGSSGWPAHFPRSGLRSRTSPVCKHTDLEYSEHNTWRRSRTKDLCDPGFPLWRPTELSAAFHTHSLDVVPTSVGVGHSIQCKQENVRGAATFIYQETVSLTDFYLFSWFVSLTSISLNAKNG